LSATPSELDGRCAIAVGPRAVGRGPGRPDRQCAVPCERGAPRRPSPPGRPVWCGSGCWATRVVHQGGGLSGSASCCRYRRDGGQWRPRRTAG